MGELWRDLVEMLRRHPALWLPVLIADLLGYGMNLLKNGLLRLIVLHNSAQHSVLGGPVVHTQMTASAMESTSIAALLLSWLTYFVRILLYSGAFIATAALLRAFVLREPKPAAQVMPALGRTWGGIFELSLRALSIDAIAALVLSVLTPYLANHGHTVLLRSWGFNFGFTLLVLLLLSVVMPPPALRVLSGRRPGKSLTRLAQQFALLLMAVAALLAAFVSANARELAQVPAGARYPLEIVGSLVTALPYVLLFTGITLIARRIEREAADDEAV